MKTVFEYGGANTLNPKKPAWICLEQYANGEFRVTYGLQVVDRLTYREAAFELGTCIMHHLACESLIETKDEP